MEFSSINSLSVKADDACPIATRDIAVNLRNRQKAIDTAGYGPLNPQKPNNDFWAQKAERWDVSPQEAKGQKCGNCAAFIKTSRMLDCIDKGLGNESGNSAWDVINAGDLGYCEAFDFKCASARTCDAWIVGGPITEEKENNMEEKSLDEMFNELLQIEAKMAPIHPYNRGSSLRPSSNSSMNKYSFGYNKAQMEDNEDEEMYMDDDDAEGEDYPMNEWSKEIGSTKPSPSEQLQRVGQFFGGTHSASGMRESGYPDTMESRGRNRINKLRSDFGGAAASLAANPPSASRPQRGPGWNGKYTPGIWPSGTTRSRPRPGTNTNTPKPSATLQNGLGMFARNFGGKGTNEEMYMDDEDVYMNDENSDNKKLMRPGGGMGPASRYKKPSMPSTNPGSPRDQSDRVRRQNFMNWASGRNPQGGTDYPSSTGPLDIGEAGARRLGQQRGTNLMRMRSWTNPSPRPRTTRPNRGPGWGGPPPRPHPAPYAPIRVNKPKPKPRDYGSDLAPQEIASGPLPIKSAWDQEMYEEYGIYFDEKGIPYSSTRRMDYEYGPSQTVGNPGAGVSQRQRIRLISSDAMPYRAGKGSDQEMYWDDEDEEAIPPDMDDKEIGSTKPSGAQQLRQVGDFFSGATSSSGRRESGSPDTMAARGRVRARKLFKDFGKEGPKRPNTPPKPASSPQSARLSNRGKPFVGPVLGNTRPRPVRQQGWNGVRQGRPNAETQAMLADIHGPRNMPMYGITVPPKPKK